MPPDIPAAPLAAPDAKAAPQEAAVSVPAQAEEPSSAAAAPEASAPPPEGAAAPAEPAPAPAEAAAVPEAKPSMLGGEAAKPAEATPEAQPEPVRPGYEPFALPDGLVADAERMGAFTDILGELGASQEQGQKLADLYAQEATRFRDHLAAEQHRVFDEMRADWRKQVADHPDLGGNRFETVLRHVRDLRDAFASDDAHLKEFARVLDFTGAGDHPAVILWFANAAREFQRLRGEGSPVPAQRGAPAQSRYQRRYTANQGS